MAKKNVKYITEPDGKRRVFVGDTQLAEGTIWNVKIDARKGTVDVYQKFSGDVLEFTDLSEVAIIAVQGNGAVIKTKCTHCGKTHALAIADHNDILELQRVIREIKRGQEQSNIISEEPKLEMPKE